MTSNIKIGPYMLLETLGVGSFGKVKRAVHSLTGHTVAIKIINKNKVVNQDMFARVKREIQYLKLLRHPHIIKLYEVISTPTSIYMVIEYAGGELFNYIVDNTRLSEDEARRFFQQIVCAIEYCHRHKIVHRDLKPENLLLDPSMNVKIADFGLSNIMTDGDFLKTSCGSPNYAAPEVISGKLYAGPEVDVWSCGVILYVMLCGRLPFDDDYIPLLFKKINGGIYSLPSFLSPETKYLLTSMLVVDPLKRITIAEIRQNTWFNVGLPEYLKPLPQGITDDAFCNLQEDIIEELMKKMNFTKETIVQALEERQNNQIKVAYQLVVDHRRMIENASQMSPQKSFQSFLATSPPPWNVSDNNNSSPNNKSATGSSAGSALKSSSVGLGGETGTSASGNGDVSSSDNDSDDLPVPSSITVLSTSLPGNTLAKELHRKASLKNTRRDRAVSTPQSPQSNLFNQPLSPASSTTTTTTTTTTGFGGASGYGHTQQYGHYGSGHGDHGTTAAFHQAAVLGNSSLGGGIPIPATRSSGASSPFTGPSSGPNGISNTLGTGTMSSNNHQNNSSSTSSSSSAAAASAAAAQRRIKARPKWYFGIRSRSAPREVMAEIYRALSNLSMKWKIINAYHLRAKYEYAPGFEVKIELQLYRLDSENYLVDFKYVGQQSAQEMEAREEMMRKMNEETQQAFSRGADVTSGSPQAGVRAGEGEAGDKSRQQEEEDLPVLSVSAELGDALAQSESEAMSDPQDIPQPFLTADRHHSLLSSTAPMPRPQPLVSFQTTESTLSHAAPLEGDAPPSAASHLSPAALMPMMPLSTSLPLNSITNISSSSSPGILSSSLMQEQQHLKEMNERRQELRHHQRQRDLKQRPTHLLFPKASYQLASAKEVTSPFPFFDVCGKLITELAIGSG